MTTTIEEVRSAIKDLANETKQNQRENQAMLRENQKLFRETQVLVKDLAKSFGGYTKNEADGIEDETNRLLYKFLVANFGNHYNIFKLNAWKTLQSEKIEDMKNVNEKSITEFDGLYVLSKDDDYYVDKLLSRKTTLSKSKEKYFVILESKHLIDRARVDKKIEQIKEFQRLLRTEYIPGEHTIEFKKKRDNYEIGGFDQTMYLFFASPHITRDTQQYLVDNANAWFDSSKLRVGFLVPEGNRYGQIKWFGDGDKLSSQSLQTTERVGIGMSGGKRKTTKRKTKTTKDV